MMNAEDKLVNDLKQSEHILQIVAVEDLLKEKPGLKSVAKEAANWAAPIKDSVDAAKIIREFGMKTNKVLLKKYAGKQYIIFKGIPGARKVLRGTRYLTANPKVVRMAVGPKGVIKSVKGGFVLTVILSVGIEIYDYFINDATTLSQLLGTVTSDLIKIGLSTIAAAVAGLAVGSAAVIGTVAAAPLIAAIAVGVVTGMMLNYIDKKLGATAALIQAYEDLGVKLSDMQYEAKRTYNFLESNPGALMQLFGGGASYYGGY